MAEQKSIRQGYGDGLAELGEKFDNVVALDGDLAHATGSLTFAEKFPNRFFNAGIAEQDLMCMAAGLSHSGFVPFASSFAVFSAGRAFEIIRNSICYTKANVKIAGSHAGITATGDGGTHQCIEDLALMRVLPNMTVFSPCDYNQTKILVRKAYEINGPVYIRVSRAPLPVFTKEDDDLVPGKAQVIRNGKDICIVATGIMVWYALQAAESLEKDGISAAVINIHTVKPLDEKTLVEYAKKCGKVLTVEEHSVIGGLGEAVAHALIGKAELQFDMIGINDRFGQSGLIDEIMQEYGMTKENIIEHCKKMF